MSRIAFITPPLIKPAEPGLSGAAAAAWFRARGVDAISVDASIGWYRHTLGRLEPLLDSAEAAGCPPGTLASLRHTARQATGPAEALRRPGTYRDRRVYSSATNHLVNVLRLASAACPGFQLRVADVEVGGRRPHRSGDLAAVARAESPFDTYFLEELMPFLERERVTHAALSITFLNQAFAGFRLAHLLSERLPSLQRLAGGPLVACWNAVGAPIHGEAFALFHRVCPASEGDMASLALELGGTADGGPEVLAPDLSRTPWEAYLVPVPAIPVALGRGCYWRRCTFCPDHLHPAQQPSGRDALSGWLEAVAARFPRGAMLHLTDSALSPRSLNQVAEVIWKGRLPLRWHGFARLEPRFADTGFMHHLAEGGCAMLQWGLETASPRLLDMMDKGVTTDQARRVLRSSAAAGIKNHAYLLFGLPTETEADREQTLAFVQAEAGSLQDLNASLLNLPKGSPMHAHPERYGITALTPFGSETDLSLYSDFRCGDAHPRLEARRWLAARFLKDPAVKGILGDLNAPFKENHACFLP